MKKTAKYLALIVVFTILLSVLPLHSFAVINYEDSIPSCSYPYCPSCSEASLVFVSERCVETTYNVNNCPNATVPHEHRILRFYNDYYCANCGIFCTEYTGSDNNINICPIAYYK